MIRVTNEERIEVRQWAIYAAIEILGKDVTDEMRCLALAEKVENYVLGKKIGDEDKNIRRRGRKTV